MAEEVEGRPEDQAVALVVQDPQAVREVVACHIHHFHFHPHQAPQEHSSRRRQPSSTLPQALANKHPQRQSVPVAA